MQDERLATSDLDQSREVRLVLGRVDERLLVVIKQPKVLVQAHIDARRLHHGLVIRLKAHPSAIDLGLDVTV